MKRFHVPIAVAGAALLAAPGPALAGEGGDVGVRVVAGKLTTFEVLDTPEGEVLGDPELVFAADWGELFPGFGADPGFFGLEGTFDAPTTLRFDFPTGLRKWNEADTDFDFATETVEASFLGESVLVPTGDTSGIGLEIGVGSSEFDEHPDWQLTPDDAVGIYLIEMNLVEVTGNFDDTGSFWTVVNFGMSEELHDEVIEYVEDNIAPAPGSLALLGLAGLAATRRRR